jgi:hypothetical protein
MSGEQSAEQNHNQSREMYPLDMCKIQTLDNDINKSKLEQIKFCKFLLPFRSESFVFPFVT